MSTATHTSAKITPANSASAPAGWTTGKVIRICAWITLKLIVLVLLARTDALRFMYAGF